MKENIYTIPMLDAMRANDECPFCFIEKNLEEHALNFTLSPSTASYMESDIREQTDRMGFCRDHHRKMYRYGNRHGQGLILESHMKKMTAELEKEIASFKPGKSGFRNPFQKKTAPSGDSRTSIGKWAAEKKNSCYICDYIETTFPRYVETFFELYKDNAEFRELFLNSKGFCIPHFGELCDLAGVCLSGSSKEAFYKELFPIMTSHMHRVQEDITWFCDKFDYRNKDADWKTSRDAIPRTMEKLSALYPPEEE